MYRDGAEDQELSPNSVIRSAKNLSKKHYQQPPMKLAQNNIVDCKNKFEREHPVVRRVKVLCEGSKTKASKAHKEFIIQNHAKSKEKTYPPGPQTPRHEK